MFGFRRKSVDETGYLRILPGGKYGVVPDQDAATEFETVNRDCAAGWGSPAQWCEFFNGEPELSAWRFHPVYYHKMGRSK